MNEEQHIRIEEIVGFDASMPIPAARPLSDFSYERVDEDLVLFDTETMQYHTLNAEAEAIWRACDGVAAIASIAASVGMPIEIVETTVGELGEASLLQASESNWAVPISRRRAAKLIAAGVVGVVGVPTVLSVTAPHSVSAESGGTIAPWELCSAAGQCAGAAYMCCQTTVDNQGNPVYQCAGVPHPGWQTACLGV